MAGRSVVCDDGGSHSRVEEIVGAMRGAGVFRQTAGAAPLETANAKGHRRVVHRESGR